MVTESKPMDLVLRPFWVPPQARQALKKVLEAARATPQPASPGTRHQSSPIQWQMVLTREWGSSGATHYSQLNSRFQKTYKLAKQSQKCRHQNTSIQILLPVTLLPQGSPWSTSASKRIFTQFPRCCCFLLCQEVVKWVDSAYTASQARTGMTTALYLWRGQETLIQWNIYSPSCNSAQAMCHWTNRGNINSTYVWFTGQ